MVLVALITVAIVLLRMSPVGEHVSREGILALTERIEGNPWAPVLFVAAFGASMVLGLPATAFILSGGAVFGVRMGIVLSLLGANLGANLVFVVARLLGRRGIRNIVGARMEGTLAGFDELTEKRGWKGLFLLRVFPVIPFNIVNYGCGLSALRWRHFALVTLVGFVPVITVYTLLADALLDGAQGAIREAALQLAVAGSLMALLAFLPSKLGWFQGDADPESSPEESSDADAPTSGSGA